MGKRIAFYGFLLVAALLFVSHSAHAAEWRFPIGLTYASGFQDVVNLFEDNLRAHGYTVSGSGASPVGLAFQPYYQYDSGLGVGGGFGPIMMISADPYFMLAAPVNVSIRFTFMPAADVSPYVRAGISYFIASGDFVKESSPGFVGGVGIEFMRRKSAGVGIEVFYDSSSLKMEKSASNSTEDIKPGGFMAGVFVVF